MNLRPVFRVATAAFLLACCGTALADEKSPAFHWYPGYYFWHTTENGKIRSDECRTWRFVDGVTHGFPYSLSTYQPRALGASHTLGHWEPTRSYYFPYQSGIQNTAPYGCSPEPYYQQRAVPVDPVRDRVMRKGR